MRKLGDQWIEVIDGQEHMIKVEMRGAIVLYGVTMGIVAWNGEVDDERD